MFEDYIRQSSPRHCKRFDVKAFSTRLQANQRGYVQIFNSRKADVQFIFWSIISQATIDETNDIRPSTIPRSRSINCCKLNEYFCISFKIMVSASDGVVTIEMAWAIRSASLNLGRHGRWEASGEVSSGESDGKAAMTWGRVGSFVVCSISSATPQSGRRERLEASGEVRSFRRGQPGKSDGEATITQVRVGYIWSRSGLFHSLLCLYIAAVWPWPLAQMKLSVRLLHFGEEWSVSNRWHYRVE